VQCNAVCEASLYASVNSSCVGKTFPVCTACPDNHTSAVGSNGQDDCYCKSGYYLEGSACLPVSVWVSVCWDCFGEMGGSASM